MESGDESSDDEEPTKGGVAAIAIASTTSTPPKHSLFTSPNENVNPKCLMARASAVTLPTPILSLDDASSLNVKKEAVELCEFLKDMDGPARTHMEACMSSLGKALETIDEKEDVIFEMLGHAREAANEIADLSLALDEERSLRARLLEEQNGLEESHSLSISSLIKERDHALALAKVLKNANHELQRQVTKELAKIPPLSIIEVPCSTNSTCEHGDLIEENKKLKVALEKGLATCFQGEKNLNEILGKQRDYVNKEGLGFVEKPKKKKKNNNKKKNGSSLPSNVITFVKEGEKVSKEKDKKKGRSHKNGVSGSSKTGVSAPTHNDFNDKYHPNYVLCRDYYGHTYAKYVGPLDDYVEWAIWVPKILVTNIQGPIKKWVPKSKN